jgi:hypothetical protein
MSSERRSKGAKCSYVETAEGMKTPEVTDNIRRPNGEDNFGRDYQVRACQICKIRIYQTPNKELVKHGQDARERLPLHRNQGINHITICK